MAESVAASTLRKGDRITDGVRIGEIITTPMRPKRKPGRIAFDVRIGPTIHGVTVYESEEIELVGRKCD